MAHGLQPLPTVVTRQRFGQTGLLLLPMVTLRNRRAYVDGQQVASGLVRQHVFPCGRSNDENQELGIGDIRGCG